MQISIQACTDNQPEVVVDQRICVIAGTTIDLPVSVSDIDSSQQVRLFATGGPFIQEFSPAILTGSNNFQDSPLTERFIWDTNCEHISNNDYQVVFRGQDNSINEETGNSVLKTLKIRVLGPPPENVQITNADLSLIHI